jgi:hypothetical protein
MRFILLLIISLTALSCRSTSPFIGYSGNISISAQSVIINSTNQYFNDVSIGVVLNSDYVGERGDFYLNKVLDGYYPQTSGVNFSNDDEASLSFRVKKVQVRNGFTMNFVDPGPIYQLKMEVDIFENGEFVTNETYRSIVNMARVVKGHRVWNWLKDEDKENIENQIDTFGIGLRGLYRNLYFRHLDISLTL